MKEQQYWLADGNDVDQYGTVWSVRLTDGPHSKAEGVATALKIIKGIGLDRGQNRNYVMVTVEPVPNIAVKLNDKSISACKSMMPKI